MVLPIRRKVLAFGFMAVVIGVAGLLTVVVGGQDDKIELTADHGQSKTEPKAGPNVEGAIDDTSVEAATPQPQPSNPSTAPSTTPSPKTEKPKPATPGAAPKPIPQPTATPTRVTGVSVSFLNGCAGTYKYTVNYEGNTAASVSMRWEIVAGDPNYQFGTLDTLPSGYPIAATTYNSSGSFSDTKSPGLPLFQDWPYSARIHVTSPNDAYSNIVNVSANCR